MILREIPDNTNKEEIEVRQYAMNRMFSVKHDVLSFKVNLLILMTISILISVLLVKKRSKLLICLWIHEFFLGPLQERELPKNRILRICSQQYVVCQF